MHEMVREKEDREREGRQRERRKTEIESQSDGNLQTRINWKFTPTGWDSTVYSV